jgi:antiviral defense system Shedu protein SduA
MLTMAGRADAALYRQLEYTEGVAASEEVKEAIASALTHMLSGGRSHRGGLTLVKRLQVARLRASEEAEWDVVRLLQDALDYTDGKILKPEFEERYRLFQDGGRSVILRDLLSGILGSAVEFATSVGRRYLTEHENTSASELLDYLDSLGRDARFMDAPDDQPGRYRIVRGRAEDAKWLERVLRNRIYLEDPSAEAHRLAMSSSAVRALVNDSDGQALLRAAELKRRSESLTEIQAKIADPSVLESDLQRSLEDKPWIFGGRFVDVAERRRLVQGGEIDIPLIRADGSMQIVEIKRAMGIGNIVKRHRGKWLPSHEVHDAVGQAINYLVELDENRQYIANEFGYDTRRASAIVLIGHPGIHPGVPESDINEAMRTFNTHLSRVEVITYKELLDNARRSLADSVGDTV